MTIFVNTDLGVFAPIVSTAGSIIAMGAALTLTWKGKTAWLPVEEDVPRGPHKAASAVASLAVALIWINFNHIEYKSLLTKIVIWCSAALLASLLLYGLLNGFVYTKIRKKTGSPPKSTDTEEVKVVGGLWLTKNAATRMKEPEEPAEPGQLRQGQLTVQRMFAMAEYDKDLLWSRPSQQLAKMLFALGYIGLIITGTVALGTAAILTGVVVKAGGG
jgi:hypothetical protein